MGCQYNYLRGTGTSSTVANYFWGVVLFQLIIFLRTACGSASVLRPRNF